MGIGGWVALRLAHGTNLPFEMNVLCGGLLAGFVGMVLSYPALRMRGLYLALVTLMAAGGFAVLINVIQFPNGGDGFTGFAVRSVAYMPRPLIAQSDAAYLRYCAGVAALGFLLIRWHETTRPGRAWAMIRRSEACAISAGVMSRSTRSGASPCPVSWLELPADCWPAICNCSMRGRSPPANRF